MSATRYKRFPARFSNPDSLDELMNKNYEDSYNVSDIWVDLNKIIGFSSNNAGDCTWISTTGELSIIIELKLEEFLDIMQENFPEIADSRVDNVKDKKEFKDESEDSEDWEIGPADISPD